MSIDTTNLTKLGSGTYAIVYRLDRHKVYKVYKYYTSKKKRQFKQSLLNIIDPTRELFGSKILEYIIDKKDKDKLNGIILEFEFHCLSNFDFNKFNILQKFYLLQKFINIFKALIVLSKNNLVYGDLKIDNVMYNIDKKKLKIIDYDFLSLHKNELSKKITEHEFCTIYFLWPPEIWKNIICHLQYYLSTLDGKSYKNDVTSDIRYLFNILQKKGFMEHSDYEKFLNFILNGEIIKTKSKWLNEFFNTFKKNKNKTFHISKKVENIKKIDIYGLGIILAQIFLRDDQFIELKPLIFKMIHPNVKDRILPESALIEFKKLIQYFKNKYSL
jgi:serine/threonine protein kinase